MQTKGVVIDKEQCPQCADEGLDTTGDNLVTFDSGVQHCFRHGVVSHSSNSAQVNREVSNVVNIVPATGSSVIEGEAPPNGMRGISSKTFAFYDYQINREKGVHIANYKNLAGDVVMQQLRDSSKNFPLLGDKNFNKTLYGSWLFTPSENVFITITEGQLDALSISNSFDNKYPVVSVPNGSNGASAVLRDNLKYLSGFKYIVLCFDNDEPGRKATEECIKLFEPGQVRIAKLPLKDANEMLQAGRGDELRKCIYSAVEYLPAPILTGDSLLETLRDYKSRSRPWPWQTANNTISPIYIPGIYTIAALPGVGKTVVMADIMRSVISGGQKIGVISLEESTPKLLLKLATALTGIDMRSIRNRALTEEEIERCRETAQSIVTYDHKVYGSSLETITENLPYISQALNCEVIMFDNLSYAATGIAEDERRGIDQAMIKLKDSTTKYQYTLFNVCHLNDDSDNFRSCTMRGSRGISMYSDYVMYLGRDVEAENPKERNTLEFYVKKDRENGTDTGRSFTLFYDVDKNTLRDCI